MMIYILLSLVQVDLQTFIFFVRLKVKNKYLLVQNGMEPIGLFNNNTDCNRLFGSVFGGVASAIFATQAAQSCGH